MSTPAEVTLSRTLDFIIPTVDVEALSNAGENWDHSTNVVTPNNYYNMTLQIHANTNVDKDLFLLERSRVERLVVTQGTDRVSAFPLVDYAQDSGLVHNASTLHKPWAWTDAQFTRVCTQEELASVGTDDPSTVDAYNNYFGADGLEFNKKYTDAANVGDLRLISPDDPTSPYKGVALIALYGDRHSTAHKFGYHRYRSDTFTVAVQTIDDADRIYGAVKAEIAGLVQPVGSRGTDLELLVVGGFTPRVDGVPYSVYPGDRVTFVGSGGAGGYVYSYKDAVSRASSSMISGDTVTFGVRVHPDMSAMNDNNLPAAVDTGSVGYFPEGIPQPTVTVTDAAGDTADITFTIMDPSEFDSAYHTVASVQGSYTATVDISKLTDTEIDNL